MFSYHFLTVRVVVSSRRLSLSCRLDCRLFCRIGRDDDTTPPSSAGRRNKSNVFYNYEKQQKKYTTNRSPIRAFYDSIFAFNYHNYYYY